MSFLSTSLSSTHCYTSMHFFPTQEPIPNLTHTCTPASRHFLGHLKKKNMHETWQWEEKSAAFCMALTFAFSAGKEERKREEGRKEKKRKKRRHAWEQWRPLQAFGQTSRAGGGSGGRHDMHKYIRKTFVCLVWWCLCACHYTMDHYSSVNIAPLHTSPPTLPHLLTPNSVPASSGHSILPTCCQDTGGRRTSL